MAKQRTMWKSSQKRQMLVYAVKHGRKAAADHYGVSPSVLYRWRVEGYGPGPLPKPQRRVGTPVRTTRVLLEEAWERIVSEIRAGSAVRDSDCYVKLALNSLTRKVRHG